MNLKSIRWQLFTSYAGIVLLSMLVLGAIMYVRLNSYYSDLERVNLERNAIAVQKALSGTDLMTLPEKVIQAQVESFAIITNSRVRLQDLRGKLVADSGEQIKGLNVVRFSSVPAGTLVGAEPNGDMSVIVFEAGSSQSRPAVPYSEAANGGTLAYPGPGQQIFTQKIEQDGSSGSAFYADQIFITQDGEEVKSPISVMPVISVFSQVGPGVEITGEERSIMDVSKARVTVPALDWEGNVVGDIELSGGPAYGRQILRSVTQAWAIAGLLGVILAGMVGWATSRRISQPVLALTSATGQMAAGDLKVRTQTEDWPTREFAALGSAFNHMAARIEETVVTLQRFAADAAHELKTPLTALRTNLELMQDEASPERAAVYLKRAEDELKQLEALMSGLLDLSRLETRGKTVEEEIDLTRLGSERSEVYAARAEQAGLVFEFARPDGPLMVMGEAPRLQQALDNLLDNAIKFTAPGGLVRLRLLRQEDRAAIQVEDSGIGIPEEDVPLLFNRFHRGRNAGEFSGSGLGLAIARIIVELHGGEIQAANRAEGGAFFQITLPLKESAQE